MKFKKEIGKYVVELTGSLVQVKDVQGMTLKAFDTNPLHSVEKFDKAVASIKRLVAKQTV